MEKLGQFQVDQTALVIGRWEETGETGETEVENYAVAYKLLSIFKLNNHL